MDLLKEKDLSLKERDSEKYLSDMGNIFQEILQDEDLSDITSNIFQEILQEISLFTTYLRLQKGDDIDIEFKVDYSKEGYLGFTEVDENGKRSIVLNLGRNELRGPGNESRIRGVILHEEAHNLFSPMFPSKDLPNLLKRLSQEFPELDFKIIENVVDFVEDYRVEYLFKGEYPGSVRNFSDVYTAILDEFALQYNPNSTLHLLFLARMATATEHTKTSNFEKMIPSELKNLYDEFVKDIEETKGKEFDSTEIATRKILKKIKDHLKEGKGNNSETELNNLEKLPKLFGSYVEGSSMTSTKLPPQIVAALNKARGQNERLKKDLGFAKRRSSELKSQHDSIGNKGSSDLRSSPPNLQSGPVKGYYYYDLRKTLEEGYSGSRLETKKSILGGRLNGREIMDRLARGEPLFGPNVRLYEIRRIIRRGTDLFVLVDTSSSMGGDLERVKDVLDAFVETTKGSRSITTHFFGFPSNSGYLYNIKPDEVDSISSSGGTPLGKALKELHDEMERTFYNPDRNYLLFVLTDGEPDDLVEAKEQLRKMKEAGIEVIVIIASYPMKGKKEEFAEFRAFYLDFYLHKEISTRKLLKELNKKLLEELDKKKVEEQKMH